MKMTSASYEISKRTLTLSKGEECVMAEVRTLGSLSYRFGFALNEVNAESAQLRDNFVQDVIRLAKHLYGTGSKSGHANCTNSEIHDLIQAIEQIA